jgi:integrase
MTTVKYDLTGLSLVMQFAKRKSYIKNIPYFPKLDVSNANPRPSFTLQEWRSLREAGKERIKTARGTRQRYEREQLYDFMLFSVHTGMRVNEVLSIRYRDCKIEQKKNQVGRKLLEIKNVVGKNDVRTVVGLIGAVAAFERLKERNEANSTDLLFPHLHRDQLNTLLNETGLKYDVLGNVRNATSFRSTYIMFRLIYGNPIKDIATNCGNSSTVIDKYYAKYIIDDLDLTEQDCEELLEGKKTKIILKIMALAQSKRLGTQVKRVRSTKELSAKMDELAKAVAISGAIAAMAVVAGLDGGKSLLSKIVGFTAGSG